MLAFALRILASSSLSQRQGLARILRAKFGVAVTPCWQQLGDVTTAGDLNSSSARTSVSSSRPSRGSIFREPAHGTFDTLWLSARGGIRFFFSNAQNARLVLCRGFFCRPPKAVDWWLEVLAYVPQLADSSHRSPGTTCSSPPTHERCRAHRSRAVTPRQRCEPRECSSRARVHRIPLKSPGSNTSRRGRRRTATGYNRNKTSPQ